MLTLAHHDALPLPSMVMRLLAALERRRLEFGPDAAAFRQRGLEQLALARLGSAAAVRRLHELLCFIRAYPDNAAVQTLAAGMLDGFASRADLRTHKTALVNSGIGGTAIRFRFFAGQAQWLATRWPQQLRFDRSDREAQSRIAQALTVLLTHAEAVALREVPRKGYATVDRLRNRPAAETDAAFLLRCIAAMPGNGFTREAFCDAIDASYVLEPSSTTPSRSTAFWQKAPVVHRHAAPARSRPDLLRELQRAPRRVRRLSMVDAQSVIDLARAAMVTRERSLEAFSFADPRDAWLVDDGDGLAFAFAGVVPERRHALFSYYGALTLRNGVPIGYTQADVLGVSAALSFNTFDTFRGGEAAYTFVRWLAALQALFGTRHFTIEPYQLGDHNLEAIQSGAWWFYAKLGFAPRHPDALRRMVGEQQRLIRRPAARSTAATLQALARHHLFLDLGVPRALVTPAVVGDWMSEALATGPVRDREQAAHAATAELARLCTGADRPPPRRPTAQHEALKRMAPLLLLLAPERWPLAQRRSLLALARAKASRSERDFVKAWQAHPRLDVALLERAHALMYP